MQKDDRQDNPLAGAAGDDAAGDAEMEAAQDAHTWQQPWVRWLAGLAVLFALTGLIALSATWVIAERGRSRVLDQIVLDARRPLPDASTRKLETGPQSAQQNAAPAPPIPAATLTFPTDSSREPTRSAPAAVVPDQGGAQIRPSDPDAPAAIDACASEPAKLRSEAAARRVARAGPALSPAARIRAIRMRAALQRYRALHPQKARARLPAGAKHQRRVLTSNRASAQSGRH